MKRLFVAILLLMSLFTFAEPITNIEVIDGDTIAYIAKDEIRYKVRLYGIDAPEKSQPFGKESCEILHDMLRDPGIKSVHLQLVGHDKYMRQVRNSHNPHVYIFILLERTAAIAGSGILLPSD